MKRPAAGVRSSLRTACLLAALALPAVAPASDATDSAAILARQNAGLRRTVLENGLICLVKEDHSAPVVAIQIWVGSGSINEGTLLGAGLSHAIEHMIFKGTPTRGPAELSRAISDVGGDINAYTSLDRTVFHTDLPSRHWRTGLEVLTDAILNSNFPDEEWTREKDVILREFAMGRDDPNRIIGHLLWATAYTVHPYRHPVIGYENIFKEINRTHIVDFFKRNYLPDNMIVSIVGDVPAGEVEAAVARTLGAVPRRSRPPEALPVEPGQISPRFARQTGAFNVSRLEMAWPTVALSHPDTPVLDMLASIVGSGRTSRLEAELKEKRRLVHSIEAGSYTPRHPGMFVISATFDPEKEKEVVAAISDEVARWHRETFARREIDKVRRAMVNSELLGLQTMHGQAGSYASGEFYASDPRLAETYLRLLENGTPATLQAAVRNYLTPSRQTLVILAPTPPPSTNAVAPAVTDAVVPPRKITLPNGLRVLIREDHRLPFVSFCVAFTGGILAEEESNNGITALTSELLTRGTTRRSGWELATLVENLGGTFTSFSGYNSFGLRARCRTADVETFAGILTECIARPAFPQVEIDKQKDIQIAAIAQEEERPMFLASKALRAMLFPNHPYRMTPSGTRASVTALSRNDLAAFHRRLCGTGNMVLSIFGDISPSAAEALARKHFGRLPSSDAVVLPCAAAKPALPGKNVQQAPRTQTIVLLGFPGVSVQDPRADAVTVLQSSLSGLASELGVSIREKRGLAYFTGAFQQAGLAPGLFAVYAGTRQDALAEVEQLIRTELARLGRDGLTRAEFDRARNQLIADHEMSLQDNFGIAMTAALDEVIGLGFEHSFRARQRYHALTLDQVRATAAALFAPDRAALSVVLPQSTKKEDRPRE